VFELELKLKLSWNNDTMILIANASMFNLLKTKSGLLYLKAPNRTAL
jgi:hypothetical protein